MTKNELKEAFAMAQRGEAYIEVGEMALFDGFGLKDFAPICCTMRQLAGLIVWQCQTFAGTWDMEAFNEIAEAGKRKFTIVG